MAAGILSFGCDIVRKFLSLLLLHPGSYDLFRRFFRNRLNRWAEAIYMSSTIAYFKRKNNNLSLEIQKI